MPNGRRPKPVSTNRVARSAVTIRVAARLGWTAIQGSRFGLPLPAGVANALNKRNSDALARDMAVSRGALMKLGQLLSFMDASLVPETHAALYRQGLSVLRSDAQPVSFEDASTVVRSELGERSAELLAAMDEAPFAAASIGQVHAATLGDGTRVAVKVQYPGIDRAIEADLANANALVAWLRLATSLLGGLATSLDLKAVVGELADRVREEVDYERELGSIEHFTRLYAGDPTMRFPTVYPSLSSRRVLTMQLVEGLTWEQACEASDDLRQAWGRAIYRFVFESLFRHGLVNADPHPANYVFHSDGSVTFLDFGCIKRCTPEFVADVEAFCRAIMTNDSTTLVTQLATLGFLRPGEAADGDGLLAWLKTIYAPLVAEGEFEFTSEFAKAVVATFFDSDGPTDLVQGALTFPPSFLFVERAALGAYSILAGLRARGSWGEMQEAIWSSRSSVDPRPLERPHEG